MWDIFKDVGVWEWYRIRFPRGIPSWGQIHLPHPVKLPFYLDQKNAAVLAADIKQRYPFGQVKQSLFEAYGLNFLNGIERERAVMEYLAQQIEYIRSYDDMIIITHHFQ